MNTEGDNLRDEGHSRVLSKIKLNPQYVAYLSLIRERFLRIAFAGEATLDDAIKDTQRPLGFPPNALGAMIRKLAVAGHIRKIGYKKSTITSRHSAVVAVWTTRIKSKRSQSSKS